MKELTTIGIAKTGAEIENLVKHAREWIDQRQQRRQPRLALFGEERQKYEGERLNAEIFLSNTTNK